MAPRATRLTGGWSVRTCIQYNSGNGVGKAGRVLVVDLRAVAVNHSDAPATEIHYRHVDYAPEWVQLSARVLPTGAARAERVFKPVARFETAEDHSELVAGTEFRYDHGGTTWVRQGDALPAPVPPHAS